MYGGHANSDTVRQLRELAPPHKSLGWEFFAAALKGTHGTRFLEALVLCCDRGETLGLDGFTFVNPEGLLWLLLLGEVVLKQLGKPLKVALPNDAGQLRHIRRLNFLRASYETLAVVNGYRVTDMPHTDDLSFRFSHLNCVNVDSLPRLLTAATRFLSDDFFRILGMTNLGEERFETSAPFRQSPIELADNILEHSREAVGVGQGFIVMRPMPKGYPVLRLAVGDAGKGIRARLTEKGRHVKDDYEAIRAALFYRYLYPRPEKPGLFKVLQYVARRSGTFRIRSGNVGLTLNLQHKRWRTIGASSSETYDAVRRMLPEHMREGIPGVSVGVGFPGVQLLVDLRIPDWFTAEQEEGFKEFARHA